MTVVVDFEELVKNTRHELRASEALIADVILRDQDLATSASITEIARAAGVSPSSVTRFCRALGFSGVRDLKICLAQNVLVRSRTIQQGILETNSLPGLVEMMTKGLANVLEDLVFEVSTEVLATAISALKRANHVYILPIGSASLGLAHYASNKLLKLGICASIQNSTDNQRSLISAASADSVFLVLGLNSQNSSLVNIVNLLIETPCSSIIIAPPTVQVQHPNLAYFQFRIVSQKQLLSDAMQQFRFLSVLEILCLGITTNLVDDANVDLGTKPTNRPTPLKR